MYRLWDQISESDTTLLNHLTKNDRTNAEFFVMKNQNQLLLHIHNKLIQIVLQPLLNCAQYVTISR